VTTASESTSRVVEGDQASATQVGGERGDSDACCLESVVLCGFYVLAAERLVSGRREVIPAVRHVGVAGRRKR
jgi:hypothetical protein